MLSQELSAYLASTPTRLLALIGIARDFTTWDLVPRLIGEDLWAQVEAVADGGISNRHTEIDPSALEPLRPTWDRLLEVGQAGKLKAIPRPRSERDREFDLITRDPAFYETMPALLHSIFEDETEGDDDGMTRWPE
jgi:hypothetical protein